MSIDPLERMASAKAARCRACSECFKKTKETTVGGMSKGESDGG